MNAPAGPFLNARRAAKAARLVACVALAGSTAACIGSPLTDARVDPASPVAPEIARVARADLKTPRFTDIPPKPTDVRPARQYGQQARAITLAGDQVVQATAPETWSLSGTDAFVAKAQAQAGAKAGADNTAEAESFAATGRKRATPPPPPSR